MYTSHKIIVNSLMHLKPKITTYRDSLFQNCEIYMSFSEKILPNNICSVYFWSIVK